MVSGVSNFLFTKDTSDVCKAGFTSSSLLQGVNSFVNRWEVQSFLGFGLPFLTLIPSIFKDLFDLRAPVQSRTRPPEPPPPFALTRGVLRAMVPEMASSLLNKCITFIPGVRSHKKDEFNTSGHAFVALPYTRATAKAAEQAKTATLTPVTIASYALSTLFAASNALMIYNTVTSCHSGMEMLAGFAVPLVTSWTMYHLAPKIESVASKVIARCTPVHRKQVGRPPT
jgi:hypothetical protein